MGLWVNLLIFPSLNGVDIVSSHGVLGKIRQGKHMLILKTEYNSSCSHHYYHLHHLQRLTSSSFGSHLGTEAGAQMFSERN